MLKLPFFWAEKIDENDPNSLSEEFAELISVIFDPFLITIVMLLIILKYLQLTFSEASLWFLLVMGLSVVPTVLYVLRGMHKGEIHDWFISERKERYKVLVVSIASLVLLNLISTAFNTPALLVFFMRASLVLGVLLAATTLLWKVSFHAAFFAFFCSSMMLVFGMKYGWLFLLFPLVGWSRTKLKKHSWAQVIAGGLISIGVTWLVFNLNTVL